jgi:hypothetical protein
MSWLLRRLWQSYLGALMSTLVSNSSVAKMVTYIKFDYVIRVRTFLVYLILVGYLVLAIVDTLFLRISRVT